MSDDLISSYSREEWLKLAWDDEPPQLDDDVRRVLEQYSHVPADQVIQHVSDIRDKAFKIFPYPCIGRWRFLNLAIGRHPLYEEVKTRMLGGKERFFDLGCAFAQDVRRLVADGVDSSKCYGSDLRSEFVDLGYELFCDGETLKTTFLMADIFDENNSLSQMHGKINIINSSSFFHLFSWTEQKQIAHQCLKFWTGQKGDLLVGRQAGNPESGDFSNGLRGGLRFRHNTDSWKRMWKEVGDEAGIEFDVQAKFLDIPGLMPDGMIRKEASAQMFVFSVRRL